MLEAAGIAGQPSWPCASRAWPSMWGRLRASRTRGGFVRDHQFPYSEIIFCCQVQSQWRTVGDGTAVREALCLNRYTPRHPRGGPVTASP
jgi:hypothetical protein